MRNKLILLSLFLLLVLPAVLTGCNVISYPNNDQPEQEVYTLYFLNEEGTGMASEERSIEKTENFHSAVVDELLKGPEGKSLKPAISAGTKLLSVALDDDNLTVNLSGEFLASENQLLARYTLIYTMGNLSDVLKTKILVEGKEITSLSTGEPLEPLGSEDIVADIQLPNSDVVSFPLYFVSGDATGLVRELREVKAKEGEVSEHLILSELLKGPKTKGAVAVIAPEAKLLTVETTNSVCFVNFSQELFLRSSGSTTELFMVYSIVNSLTELPSVRKVQLLIDGKKVNVSNHVDISEPLERDAGWILKE